MKREVSTFVPATEAVIDTTGTSPALAASVDTFKTPREAALAEWPASVARYITARDESETVCVVELELNYERNGWFCFERCERSPEAPGEWTVIATHT